MVLILKLPNVLELVLLFHLESSLLNRFIKQNVQNWLDFNVIVEKVVVFNLSDFVDTCLLWNVFWSRWFRLEYICLQFHFCLIRFCFALFSQEIFQIYLNARRRPRSQIIWTCGILRLLELHQLRFNHFDLFLFTFFLNPLLLFLRRCDMLLKYILIVSITSEDPLIVHNVQCLAAFLFLGNRWIQHTILGTTIFVFSSYHLWLSSFKTLSHLIYVMINV